ncbi:hypothetical protein N7495_006586 [Penicillium taxi]|uniref:uncharacterized protein n=1 Tax=Penicillium taxi TaxID=168475 RepID=UPI0025456D61|nr:uncharacterized protein N7495_006586 [Penicillium taxi]KAJ5894895.1 hypothetical protein N7495_006586 [Penicillium taxi]
MQLQRILAALVSLSIAVSAAPSRLVAPNGAQVQSVTAILKGQGNADTLAADQSISCTVAYTLSLSAGAPYTIDLASLDLQNCTYTAA